MLANKQNDKLNMKYTGNILLETNLKIEDIQNLIRQGESKTLEFKKSLASLDTAGKALCGFLNQTHGGSVLVGVNDNGKIIGQEHNDSVSKKIAAFLNRFQPTGRIDSTYINLNNKDKKVIVFKAAPLAHEQPYSYDGKYYQRLESTTQQLSHEQIRYLYLESSDAAKIWGKKTSGRYKLDNLDFDEIKKTVKRAIEVNRIPSEALEKDVELLLKSWKLIVDDHLTHSAMILFAKDIEAFLPQCKIRMARFQGNDKYGIFIDNRRYFGNAFQILRVAEDFIRKHHFISSRFDENSFERIDEPTLPVLAVREALINAICHRNYRDNSSAINLAIYDSYTEIWNSGKLPPGWTLDKLKEEHPSEPRNELVAKVFYDRKFIENWGRGIQKIIKECQKAGIPEPEYREYGDGVAIILRYKTPLIPVLAESSESDAILTSRQKEILLLLKKGDLPMKELFAISDKFSSERTLKRDLNNLKEMSLLITKGKGRNTVWSIKDSKSKK